MRLHFFSQKVAVYFTLIFMMLMMYLFQEHTEGHKGKLLKDPKTMKQSLKALTQICNKKIEK